MVEERATSPNLEPERIHEESSGPAGDASAMTLDPRQQGDFVWRVLQRQGVRPAELDDALQEVFLAAHRRQASFDPTRGKLTTWLFGICIRVAWAQRRRRRASTEEAHEPVEHETPEAVYGRQQHMRLLSRALDELSPQHRATFVLFELEGHSCADIAELGGVPVGTVYSRLHTARAALRRALESASAAPPSETQASRAIPSREHDAPRPESRLPIGGENP